MTGGGLSRLMKFASRSNGPSADDDDGGSSKDTGNASVENDDGRPDEVHDEMFERLKREAEDVVR